MKLQVRYETADSELQWIWSPSYPWTKFLWPPSSIRIQEGDIAARWAKNIGWALSGPYHRIRPRILLQQQPHLRKTNLKASWVSGKISILTLRIAILPIIWEINRENSRHWSKQLCSSGEIFEAGLLWREDEVKFSKHFSSDMVQLESLEWRLQKRY